MRPSDITFSAVTVVNLLCWMAMIVAMLFHVPPPHPVILISWAVGVDVAIWLYVFFAIKSATKTDRQKRPWMYHR